MELKSLGTFSQVGRPIDTIRFELMNANQIKYQSIGTDAIQMPTQSIVKINQDPHPDYFKALNELIPFAIEVLDLGNHWKAASSIGSLKLDWTYSNQTEKFTYKIAEICITRLSGVGELCIPRMLKFGGIVDDEIPWQVKHIVEEIVDEAWLYCCGLKTANVQLNLFENQSSSGLNSDDVRSFVRKSLVDREFSPDVIAEYLEFAGDTASVKGFEKWFEDEDSAEILDITPLRSLQMAVVEQLLEVGIETYRIHYYLRTAGDSPSVEGFHDWLREQVEEEDPIVVKKATRSKSTKKAA